MLWAIFWSIIVLPALGGETTRPLCPFPMGEQTSMILAVISSRVPLPLSNLILLSACNGVRFSKRTFPLAFSGDSKLIWSTFNIAKYLSVSFGGLIFPDTVSPVLKPNFLIWLGETYISSGPAK